MSKEYPISVDSEELLTERKARKVLLQVPISEHGRHASNLRRAQGQGQKVRVTITDRRGKRDEYLAHPVEGESVFDEGGLYKVFDLVPAE